jgi:hypothetical protein
MAADFSLTGYAELVDEFRSRGYTPRSFFDAQPGRPDLILRHDVDIELESARELASWEAQLGLRATYFVLLRTELYNALAPRATAEIHAIRDAGHAVGLHFDAGAYPAGTDLDDACRLECDLLERICERPIELVSFHRPVSDLLGRVAPIGGRRHAYEPIWFRDTGYCSDSRGGWHHGHPLEHSAVAAGRALQLLTHPIWWVHDVSRGPIERLEDFVDRRTRALSDELARNCEPWRRARPSDS